MRSQSKGRAIVLSHRRNLLTSPLVARQRWRVMVLRATAGRVRVAVSAPKRPRRGRRCT